MTKLKASSDELKTKNVELKSKIKKLEETQAEIKAKKLDLQAKIKT